MTSFQDAPDEAMKLTKQTKLVLLCTSNTIKSKYQTENKKYPRR